MSIFRKRSQLKKSGNNTKSGHFKKNRTSLSFLKGFQNISKQNNPEDSITFFKKWQEPFQLEMQFNAKVIINT